MEINSYYIKVVGKSNIPNELGIGHNYNVVMDCSITSETKVDNEDGTYDIIYKVEPVTATIQKDNGQIIKAKDLRNNSVKFRKSCWRVADNNQIDSDKFYDFATAKSISMLDTLAVEFKKLFT